MYIVDEWRVLWIMNSQDYVSAIKTRISFSLDSKRKINNFFDRLKKHHDADDILFTLTPTFFFSKIFYEDDDKSIHLFKLNESYVWFFDKSFKGYTFSFVAPQYESGVINFDRDFAFIKNENIVENSEIFDNRNSDFFYNLNEYDCEILHVTKVEAYVVYDKKTKLLNLTFMPFTLAGI